MNRLTINIDKLERMRQLMTNVSSPSFTNPVCNFIKYNKTPDKTFSNRQCRMYSLIRDAVVLPPERG